MKPIAKFGAWVLLMGVLSWPAAQMYLSTELVVNRLELAQAATDRMKRDFPSKLTSVLAIMLSSDEPIVCLEQKQKQKPSTNETCANNVAALTAIEKWAQDDADVIEYRSYTTYDQTDLDDLKEMFVADEHRVLVCVSLPRTEIGDATKAVEMEQRILAEIQGMLPSSVSMRHTGVNTIKIRVEQDTQMNAMRTEVVTVPFAMMLFAAIFGNFRTVLLLVLQLLTVAVLSFGTMGVVIPFQRVPILDTTQCVIMELFALAFTTDYTFLMLRRFQQERQRGTGLTDALDAMSVECGHVVKVSGGLIIATILAMGASQLENLCYAQFVGGVTIMMTMTILSTTIGVPYWIKCLGIDFPQLQPTKFSADGRLTYDAVLRALLGSKARTAGTMATLLLLLALPTLMVARSAKTKTVAGWDYAWTSDVYSDANTIGEAFPIINQGFIVLTGLDLTNDLRGAFDAAANVTATLIKRAKLDPDDLWSAAGYLGDRVEASDAARLIAEDALYREIWEGSVGLHNDSLSITMTSNTPLQSDAHMSEWRLVHAILKEEPLLVSPDSILRYSESEGYLLSTHVMMLHFASSLLLALLVGVSTLGVVLKSVFLPARMLLTVVVPLAAVFSLAQWIFGFVHLLALYITLPLLFGLALDYELFLVLRVKEYRWKGVPTLEAVRTASVDTNTTIMLAGLVMMISFSGFCWMDSPLLHQMGFVIEMGVFLDTFVVRPWLVPCMMSLGESWIWWPSVPPSGIKIKNADPSAIDEVELPLTQHHTV